MHSQTFREGQKAQKTREACTKFIGPAASFRI